MSPPPLSMFSKRNRCLTTRHCAKCRISFSRRISAPRPRKRRKVSASRSRNRFAPRLLEGTIRNAVNMPNLDAKTLAIVGPHLRFGEKLGRFLSQIAPRRVENLNINYSGKVNEVDTTAITRSVLKGFLQTRRRQRSQRSERARLRRKSWTKNYRDASERRRRLHRSARAFRVG